MNDFLKAINNEVKIKDILKSIETIHNVLEKHNLLFSHMQKVTQEQTKTINKLEKKISYLENRYEKFRNF